MSVNNPEDMNEVEFDTMTLSLDDGTELECAVLAIFPVQEKKYIALSPMSGEDEGTVYLYHFASDENDEEVTLLNIEDDDEFDAVSDAFDEKGSVCSHVHRTHGGDLHTQRKKTD